MQLNENTYLIGIWFSSNPSTLDSWLGYAIRDPDNPDKYKIFYRFRHKKDGQIFDSQDEKYHYGFLSNDGQSEDDIINLIDQIQSSIELAYPEKDKVIIKGDVVKMFSLCKDKSWFHIKQR